MAGVEEGSFDRSLTVSGPVDLEVKTASGGITVTSGDSGSVRVHAILRAENGWFSSGDVKRRIEELERHPPVEQTGNHLRIGYVQDPALLKGISITFEISAPLDTQLRARANSGGIRVEGIRGPVDCKADSGGIRIRDAKAAVHAEADSGGLHLDNIAGDVFARADSGGIEAMDVAGAIDARADSGSIRLSQTEPASIRAKADSGGVKLRLAPRADYDVSVEAGSGSISVPEMTVRSGFSAHHLEGKVGKGGPLVQIRVDSGSVTVE
jgi:DUF4097 and DUF4098 domain-containing protein YvlB